jgi:signal transduction histidine kinase
MSLGVPRVEFPDQLPATTGSRQDLELEQLRLEVERLRRENRTYAKELKNTQSSARVVVDELDTEALAKAIARRAMLTLNAERALVGVIEYDAVVVQASCCNDDAAQPSEMWRYPTDLKVGPGQGLAPWVVQRRQPFLCLDARGDANLGPDYAARHRCRNALCVPIQNHQGIVIGFIEVQNRRDAGVFTPDDIPAAETLALQASVGFQRSRLIDRLAEWTRSLEMLLAFNAAVNQHMEPAGLVRRLVENAAQFLKADGGMAGLAVPSGAARRMVSDGYWNRGQWHERARSWEAGHGLAGTVLESEFPALVNNYSEDRLADAELVKEFDVRQALCTPIKDSRDRVVGFFELHRSTRGSPFTWQDAAFLESLANVTAVAIHNAQLLRSVAIKNEEIRTLSANHVTRIEEERRHIARELHDEAGQVLIGIKLALQLLATEIPQERPEIRQELNGLREEVNRATAQLKDLARNLRPATLDKLGLEAALRQLASDFHRKTGLPVDLELDSVSPRLSQGTEIALYRIAQEALTNVARHAQAHEVRLSLQQTDTTVELCISDDGRGFDQTGSGRGLGLLGMNERAAMLAGELTVLSAPGEGTSLKVRAPHV